MEPVALEYALLQCWTLFFAHRWELRRVAHHHQTATLATIYILYQVVEQTARAEEAVSAVVGHHRGFIDDEQG